MKKAVIIVATGQDGANLALFLRHKGYEAQGIKRRSSSFNTSRMDHLYKAYRDPHEADVRFFMHYGDLTDTTNLIRLIEATGPNEIYTLAAHSHVKVSFESPEYTANAPNKAGAPGHPLPGKPGYQMRLGKCRGIRGGQVAHAPGG